MILTTRLQPTGISAKVPVHMVLGDIAFEDLNSPIKKSLLVDTFKGFYRNQVVCVRKLRYYGYNGDELLAVSALHLMIQ
jgi:hypothetical protein